MASTVTADSLPLDKFKAFFDNGPLYYFMVSPEGVILDVNQSALDALDYEKGKIVGNPHKIIYADEAIPKIESLFEDWKRTGQIKNEELTIISGKGEKRIVLLSADAIKDADGNILCAISVQQDITDYKKIKEALRKERDFANRIIETARVIIMTLDIEGRIDSFNPFMEELSGYTLDEVKGKDWFDTFLTGGDKSAIRELFKKALGNIRTSGNVNPIVKKDGTVRHIEWYDSTLHDSRGKVSGLLAIGLDVTEKKNVEEKLRIRIDDLERFSKIAVGRELAMGDMKKEVNMLLQELGRPMKYKV